MHAISPLSVVPIRELPSHKSEQVSQLLYGEICEVIENQGEWSKIRCEFDAYEGWVDTKQIFPISDSEKQKINSEKYATNLVDVVQYQNGMQQPICLGAVVSNSFLLHQSFLGDIENFSTEHLSEIAFKYLDTPYLWGGRTPFGIDCSGFTQMVFKMIGKKLPRDAYQQVNVGQIVSFLEETQVGDLAFFDNEDGKIVHTGIILHENRIIHAHGKVRLDVLDHNGIYNSDFQKYTHKLRVIKRIL